MQNIIASSEQIKAKEVNEALAAEGASGVFAERAETEILTQAGSPWLRPQRKPGPHPLAALHSCTSGAGGGRVWRQGALGRTSFTQVTFPS